MKTKNKKHWALVIVLLVLALCLLGCRGGNQKNPDALTDEQESWEESIGQELQKLTYEDIYIREIEPMNSAMVFNGTFEQTIVNGHLYKFHKSISAVERQKFIISEERILHFLSQNAWRTENIVFCIQKDYEGRTNSENLTIYSGMEHMNDWEQILLVLQTLKGDYTNYGYLYGRANSIAKELAYACDDTYLNVISEAGTEKLTIEEIKKNTEGSGALRILREMPDKATLVYPLFQERYSDAETIRSVKELSALCSLLVENDSEGEEKFLKVLLDYQKESGIQTPETIYEYMFGGSECPLKIRTKFFECFVGKDYEEDAYVQVGYIESEWSKNIEVMTETLEMMDKQTEHIAKIFSYEASERFPIHLQSALAWGGTINSNYVGGVSYNDLTPYGKATTLWYLPMAYGKTIVFHRIDQQEYQYMEDRDMLWLLRGLLDYESFETLHLPEMKYYWTEEDTALYERMLGKEIKTTQDYLDVIRVFYARSYMEEYQKGEFDPETALSTTVGNHLFKDVYIFTDYLVRNYGEEQAVEVSMNPSKVNKILGKSWSEILDDWEKDLFAIID